MSKQRQVTLTGGAGVFDSISATIPLHYLKIWPDGDRQVTTMEYKIPDDSFVQTFITDSSIGDIIERIGPGRSGLLGVPTAYGRSDQVATVIIKIHAGDNSAMKINILESENAL